MPSSNRTVSPNNPWPPITNIHNQPLTTMPKYVPRYDQRPVPQPLNSLSDAVSVVIEQAPGYYDRDYNELKARHEKLAELFGVLLDCLSDDVAQEFCRKAYIDIID